MKKAWKEKYEILESGLCFPLQFIFTALCKLTKQHYLSSDTDEDLFGQHLHCYVCGLAVYKTIVAADKEFYKRTFNRIKNWWVE